MKHKKTVLVVAAMVFVTGIVALIHLFTLPSVPDSALQIEYSGGIQEISLSEIETERVYGCIVDGKGVEHPVDASGIPLSELLLELDITAFSNVTVYAEDSYSAVVSAEEINEVDRVFLLIRPDERPQLIVFGDSNSKRNVTGVIRMVVS